MNESITPTEASKISEKALEGRPDAVDATGSTLSEMLREAVAISKWKRELDAAGKLVKQAEAKLHPLLMDEMALAGMQNANIDGMTIYIQEQSFVNKKSDEDGVTKDRLCDVLDNIGWGDLVRDDYSPSSLKARVLERLHEGEEIPTELGECLNITTTHKVVIRKG